MKKLLIVGALATLLVASASAQLTPLTLEAGYYRSNNFNTPTGRSHMAGPELGVYISFLDLPIIGEIRAGASVVFAGALGGGGIDGNIYRLHAQYKTMSAGPNGLYGLAGVGFFSSDPRGGTGVGRESGVGLEFGVGLPISSGLPAAPSGAIELGYRLGPSDVLRGWSVSVNFRF